MNNDEAKAWAEKFSYATFDEKKEMSKNFISSLTRLDLDNMATYDMSCCMRRECVEEFNATVRSLEPEVVIACAKVEAALISHDWADAVVSYETLSTCGKLEVWSSFMIIADENDKKAIDRAKAVHRHFYTYILDIFGVKPL